MATKAERTRAAVQARVVKRGIAVQAKSGGEVRSSGVDTDSERPASEYAHHAIYCPVAVQTAPACTQLTQRSEADTN